MAARRIRIRRRVRRTSSSGAASHGCVEGEHPTRKARDCRFRPTAAVRMNCRFVQEAVGAARPRPTTAFHARRQCGRAAPALGSRLNPGVRLASARVLLRAKRSGGAIRIGWRGTSVLGTRVLASHWLPRGGPAESRALGEVDHPLSLIVRLPNRPSHRRLRLHAGLQPRRSATLLPKRFQPPDDRGEVVLLIAGALECFDNFTRLELTIT